MASYDIIVIGGDAAGMSAASQARRTDSSISITVFEKGSFVSYAACGMPYYIAGDVVSHEELLAIDRTEFEKKRNIGIFTDSEATAVDFDAKSVTIRGGDNPGTHQYGRLVIATGASPVIPPVPGIDSPRVFPLRNLEHGIAIRKFIGRKSPRSAIILGGGLIGLEMAESLRRLEISVTIVEKFESVAMMMSPPIRELATKTLQDHGVVLRTGLSFTSLSGDGTGVTIHCGQESLTADFAILSVGIRPNTDFLTGGPLAMDGRGAIIVDARSMTGIPGVYAAGDCATVRHLVTNTDVYMPLGTTANKQGRVAGLQAAGVTGERFPGIVGSQMLKIFELEIGKTGLNEADAARFAIPAQSAGSEGRSRAGYYPGSSPILVILTINKETRAVIGCEVAGTDGAALRANIAAAAITAGMTVEQMAYLDQGYAPPFSPVWDPLNAAAQLLVRR